MANRILLIYPRLDPEGKAHRGAPLSLLTVAAPLREAGFDVEIIDLRVDPVEDAKVDDDTLLVGFSVMTGYQIHDALELSETLREANPNVPLVWGGWHPTLLPDQTIKHPLVDIIVRGQGELTMLDLAKALKDGASYDGIAGLTFQKDGETVNNPDREIGDIKQFPIPTYDLVDMSKHIIHDPDYDAHMIAYLTSRGCVHRCGFCAIRQVYKRKWLDLPVERVLDEITHLLKTYPKANGLYFEDDNFFINRKRAKEILKGILDRDLKIKWTALGRTDHIVKFDTELLELLRDTGCIQILVGAESGSQEILDLITKDTTVEQTVKTVEMLQTYGVEPVLSFMVGFPEEVEEYDATLNLIKRLKKEWPGIDIKLFFYTPFPGSALYDYALERGLQPPEKLADWFDYTMHKVNVPWVSAKREQRLLNFLFYFRHAYPGPNPGMAKRALASLSRMRMNLNLFALPWEKKLLEALGKA
ncbi:MAG: B12-binding domain-containing radical SAM protein [Planctomycetes bacterium]|nr:B12-binding domain-containing radical SAM protein [Planctomycetota bacterium]